VSTAPLVVRAYAKINLCLEVLGEREDGLHEVATILQTISLADRLRFTPSEDLLLHCRGAPSGPDNLILRAARLIQERTGARAGCTIDCEKRIPVGGGLGGGSADAAGTLLALNRLWGTGLRAEELAALAAELGADIPFLLRGGTALATGTGTVLQPLPDAPPHWLVLVPLGCTEPSKTGSMYARLGAAAFTDGAAARRQAEAITRGSIDYANVGSAFFRAAQARWPAARAAAAALSHRKALAVAVSGSGPSVFALYGGRGAAIAGLHSLRAKGLLAQIHRFAPSRQTAPYT
jgi:4-diphosphocytidyl-2-C-methyl-D-erythritol kinase